MKYCTKRKINEIKASVAHLGKKQINSCYEFLNISKFEHVLVC